MAQTSICWMNVNNASNIQLAVAGENSSLTSWSIRPWIYFRLSVFKLKLSSLFLQLFLGSVCMSLALRSVLYPFVLLDHHHESIRCSFEGVHSSIFSLYVIFIILTSVSSLRFCACTHVPHTHTHSHFCAGKDGVIHPCCFSGIWMVNAQLVAICLRDKWVKESTLAAVTQKCSLINRSA